MRPKREDPYGLDDGQLLSRRHVGRHYAAAAFFEVKGLFDHRAKVELVCAAVVPHDEG